MSGSVAQSTASTLGALPPSTALTGTYGPGMVRQTAGEIAAAQQGKEAAQAPIYDQMQRDYQQDRSRFEGVSANFKPFERTPPPKTPDNDPFSGWAVAASLFANLAAAKTNTPAIAAMNGMASAINAARRHDWDTYEANYKKWKDETDIAIKDHELQAADMKTAMEMMQNDLTTGVAMAKAVAAKYDDRISMRLLEQGEYQKLADHQLAAGRAAAAMAEHAVRIKELNLELQDKLDQRRLMTDLQEATASGDPEKIASAKQAIRDRVEATHPELMINAERALESKNTVVTDPTNGKQYVYNPITKKSTTLTGEPYSPGGQAKIAPTQTASLQSLTPEDRRSLGAQAKTGEPLTQIVPGFGQSAIPLRQEARKAAIEQIMEDMHVSQEEAAIELSNRTIEYQAGKKSAGQLTTMLGATKQAVDQLDFNIEKAKEEMAKLPSGDLSPILNAIANGAAKWTGDPAYASAFYYVHAMALESARILSGGQASVAQLQQGAMDQAKEWANMSLTTSSLSRLGDAMHAEGKNRIENYQNALKGMKLTGQGQTGASVPLNSDGSPKEGQTGTSKSGKPIVFRNGQWVYQ